MELIVNADSTYPYARLRWVSDQEWNASSVTIYDEDYNLIIPSTVLEPDETTGDLIRVIVNAAGFENAGDYTGRIELVRMSREDADVDWDNQNETDELTFSELGISITVAALPDFEHIEWNDPSVAYSQHDEVGDVDSNGHVFHRTSGTANLYWSVRLTAILPQPFPGTYTIKDSVGNPINEDQVYGPVIGDADETIILEIDSTGTTLNNSYQLALILSGWELVGGNYEPVNTSTKIIKVLVGPSQLYYYDVGLSEEPVQRGDFFNITLTAKRVADGSTLTDYYTVSPLNLVLRDPNYVPVTEALNFIEYDATSQWDNGVLIIQNVQITGGTGVVNRKLWINEQGSPIYGRREFVLAGETFTVTMAYDITRGVAFNLTIAASDPTYVPSGNVNIDLISFDPDDAIVPTFTNNTGWVGGQKVVSCTIDGGTLDPCFCIVGVYDPVSLAHGSAEGVIAAAGVICNACGPALNWTYTVTMSGLTGWFASLNGVHTVTWKGPGGLDQVGNPTNCAWSVGVGSKVIYLVWHPSNFWYVFLGVSPPFYIATTYFKGPLTPCALVGLYPWWAGINQTAATVTVT